MNYALIGCGRVAYNHLKAAKENGLTVCAVCDIDPDHIFDLYILQHALKKMVKKGFTPFQVPNMVNPECLV